MNKKKKISNIIFTIIVFVCSFISIISAADIFSSLITVGSFSFINENITLNEYNIYCIYTSTHQTKITADEYANTIKEHGGAGYVYMNKQSYYVIASIYESESDAIKVKENLITTKPETDILKITIPTLSISSNLDSKEKNTISNSILIFKNIYKKLYDISVSLDTNIYSEIDAKLEINKIESELISVYGDFNTLFSNNLSTNLLRIKLALEELQSHLKSLIDSNTPIPFTSQVKNCYCNVLMSYFSLANSI